MLTNVLAFVVVAVRLAHAQDGNCDFVQNVTPGQSYYVYSPGYSGKYNPDIQCRWIGICPTGSVCQLDCTDVDLPQSSACSMDRLMISRSGDPQLSDAEYYCSRGQLTATSTGKQISIGLITAKNSPGGKFYCILYAKQAPTGSCSCGYKKQVRIVGGQETGVNEYPMMAGLADARIGEMKCGATIISKRHLLTAAHCLLSIPMNYMAVIVGEHNVNTGDSPATRGYKVANLIKHPLFTGTNYDYDIAIVTVSEDIVFSGLVGPVCLPFKYVGMDLTGIKLTVLGWGTLFPGGPKSEVLRKVDVDVISRQSCKATVPSLTLRQICTYTLGKDSCQDDSGGPLLYSDPRTGFLFLIGIVSYGQMCATKDKPAVNTYVTAMMDWILQNTPGVDYCKK